MRNRHWSCAFEVVEVRVGQCSAYPRRQIGAQRKNEKLKHFEVRDGLLGGLEASPIAAKSVKLVFCNLGVSKKIDSLNKPDS